MRGEGKRERAKRRKGREGSCHWKDDGRKRGNEWREGGGRGHGDGAAAAEEELGRRRRRQLRRLPSTQERASEDSFEEAACRSGGTVDQSGRNPAPFVPHLAAQVRIKRSRRLLAGSVARWRRWRIHSLTNRQDSNKCRSHGSLGRTQKISSGGGASRRAMAAVGRR